jgi:excisionase family DNA binding protein
MEENTFMDMDMLSNYICHSKAYIYKKVMRNEIPHYKMGRKTLFDRNEINRWVKNGMMPVTPMSLPKLPKL